jgi:hypothetical protein
MVSMTLEEWRRVGEAIVIWSGWGRSSWPSRSDDLVVARYGPEVAADLLPNVRLLVDEFYGSDARNTAVELADMAAASSRSFADKYPDLARDAISALAWCYTFDFK